MGNAEVAIEVKISTQVHAEDLRGLKAFCEEHPHTKAIVVSQDSAPRKLILKDMVTTTIVPWSYFLEQLWAMEVI